MTSLHKASEEKIVKTACHLCDIDCGIDVHLRDGRIVKVEGLSQHPVNYLCPKGRALIEYVYSPDRLMYPVIKVEGTWKRISWNEALDIIAGKLKQIKESYGARAVALFQGYGIGHYELKWYMQRFADVFGTPNFGCVGSLCYHSRVMGLGYTYGEFTIPDYENSQCIMIWGCNLHDSSGRGSKEWLVRNFLISRDKTKKLIVIDPRRTLFAKVADIHVQIRPGTDTALALGMLNVIVNEELYDKDFVDRWTVGFRELVEHVKSYSPEKVEKITWIPASIIRKVARIYATSENACIIHDYGIDAGINGVQSARSIGILQAVTGNIDVAGGNIFPERLPVTYIRFPEKVEEKPLGADKHPLYYEFWHEGQAMSWPDAILTGEPYPIKAMIIAGGNPVLTWPNSGKVRRTLEKLDFLVVLDPFMNATAELADVVLPAATFLERTQYCDYGLLAGVPYVMLRKKVIDPLGESWPDWKFWFELGRRLGYTEYFPWDDVEEAIDFLLEPSGLTVEQLKLNPAGMYYATKKYRRYEAGLKTRTGKVEIYSAFLEKHGYDPLPTHKEPEESPIGSPEIAKEYPLILTTGNRILEYTHSQLKNISQLRRMVPEALAEVNPKTAKELGVEDGDTVTVESRRGSISIKAKLTEDVPPWLINIPHGWAESNVNTLTDDEGRDPISGFPPFKALLCRLKKP